MVLPKERVVSYMMYVKLKEDYKAGDLVPLLNDSIYVYCDLCESYQKVDDVSEIAFGVASFEEINACASCGDKVSEEKNELMTDDKKRELVYKLLGFAPNVKVMRGDREVTAIEILEFMKK